MYQFIYFCWDKCWTMMILFFSPGIFSHIVNYHFWFSYRCFESSVTGNKPTQDFLVIFPTGRFIDQIAVVVVLDFMQLFLQSVSFSASGWTQTPPAYVDGEHHGYALEVQERTRRAEPAGLSTNVLTKLLLKAAASWYLIHGHMFASICVATKRIVVRIHLMHRPYIIQRSTAQTCGTGAMRGPTTDWWTKKKVT